VNLLDLLLRKFFYLLSDRFLNVLGKIKNTFKQILFRACQERVKSFVSLVVLCIRPMIESGKNPQKYIRFSPEDLERMLNEFFEGKTWSEPKR